MKISGCSVFLLAATAILAGQASHAQQAQPATPEPTLDRAASYFDRASEQLVLVLDSIQRGDQEQARNALKVYTRELSLFHVTMGQLRIGKQELGFANRVLKLLESQVRELESVDQRARPGERVAAQEAISHIQGALQMIRQKVDVTRRRPVFKFQGQGSDPTILGLKPRREVWQ